MKPLLQAFAFGATLCTALPAVAEAPLVAAASDLTFALDDIAAAYADTTGESVRVTYGSTGNFTRQIREGAPFDIFMAADESYIATLAQDGLTQDDGDLYARGRVVIVVPKGSSLAAEGSLDDLAAALAEGRLTRFAIANPEHAPYGQRARQALEHKGLLADITPHLVYGENVSQAAHFALSGNTQGGIIAYSLALAPDLAKRAEFALIPEDWHAPLLQRMVLLKTATPEAEAFYAYLQSPAAREIFERYGFTLPEEE